VVATKLTAPRYLELLFEGGERLRAEDSSEEYESFTITAESPKRLIVV
jgi:hypothetical protein